MVVTDEQRQNFRAQLQAHLKEFVASPILFVGSGVARRYLDMPDWRGLLDLLSQLTDRDYAYYRSNASDEPPKIASLLAEPLQNNLWSTKAASRKLRQRYEDHILRPDSALKIFAAEELLKYDPTKSPKDAGLKSEIELLRDSKVDAIITTNYDTFLETIFPDYKVFVGQNELVFSDPTGIGEIYKIHGSLETPNSLVLTQEDYRSFEERNTYLAAKLLTLFAEHPVIFLGYSFGDENVQTIMNSLAQCLTEEHILKLQDRLIFVNWTRDTNQVPTMTATVMGPHSLPVQSIVVSDFVDVFMVLSQIERKFPARMLRSLKERIFEMVLDVEAQDCLHVTNIDDASDNAEIVMGLGVIAALQKRGYRGTTRKDICMDVLRDGDMEADYVVKLTLPDLLSSSGNFPIYKYLREAGYLDSQGKIKDESMLSPRLAARANDLERLRPSQSTRSRAIRTAKTYRSLGAMIENLEPDEVLRAFGALPHSGIPVSTLRAFLVEHEAQFTQPDGKLESIYTKAICVYDLLRYGPTQGWRALS